MFRTFLLLALLVILLVPACASSPGTSAVPLPTMENNWTVKMTHSGGIMGLQRSVEVLSNGSYTVIDERANKTVTGKLPGEELARLKEIIAATEYVTPEKPGISGCADCFIYEVEVQGSGKNFSVQLNDISLPESGMDILVTFLRGLIDSTLE